VDPPPRGTPKKLRKEVIAERALQVIRDWKREIDFLYKD
jgi:hypothetical protein